MALSAHVEGPSGAPVFLTSQQFSALCLEFGLPVNDTWLVAGCHWAAKARELLDDMSTQVGGAAGGLAPGGSGGPWAGVGAAQPPVLPQAACTSSPAAAARRPRCAPAAAAGVDHGKGGGGADGPDSQRQRAALRAPARHLPTPRVAGQPPGGLCHRAGGGCTAAALAICTRLLGGSLTRLQQLAPTAAGPLCPANRRARRSAPSCTSS
jgi:hypothetical protein